MSRSVAFLRSINVGGRRVAKEQLIEVFTALGFADVDTFLASGNVLFGDGPAVTEEDLQDALRDTLGFDVPTTVRGRHDLAVLADSAPFPADVLSGAAGKPQVILLFEELRAEAAQAVADRSCPEDRLVPAGTAVHWLPAEGVSGTGLAARELEDLVGLHTVRTANTIQRLVPKL